MRGHNGCVKLPIFVSVILALAGMVGGSFAYTTSRSEDIRLEIKKDLERMEDRLTEEIRSIGRR